MKKRKAEDGEMRTEYDFSAARSNPYASRFQDGANLVLIEPEMGQYFPTSESVNAALRLLVRVSSKTVRTKKKQRAKVS